MEYRANTVRDQSWANEREMYGINACAHHNHRPLYYAPFAGCIDDKVNKADI